MTHPKNQAMSLIRQSIDGLHELRDKHTGSPEFKEWHSNTEALITELFPGSPKHASDFKKIRFTPIWTFDVLFYSQAYRNTEYDQTFQQGLDRASKLLASKLFLIENLWEDRFDNTEALASTNSANGMNSKKVFIVHGRDMATKDSVARFLADIQLRPVILQEMPNQGRTIIEKFEDYSDVGFAVVLFTPDDEGGLVGDKTSVQSRTRQNVIFELGFFLGKLGRERVAVLVKGEVEIPSDYSGVLFIQLDDRSAWKTDLMRELKVAGYSIDINHAVMPQ